MRWRLIHLCGPTASGKSAIAEALAERFNGELISVDSAQIYRGMDIGSAKPDAETRARIAHHLLDLLEPEQSYSAAQFVHDAERAIVEIQARGRLPILVGGTMLYFRALTRGLSDLPSADPETRQQLAQDCAERGLASLHAELSARDPAAGARINPNDSQRILRALEVIRITGETLSSLQQRQTSIAPIATDADTLRLALYPSDRAWLHQRIAQRFAQMLDLGFTEEVQRLRQRPLLTADHPSMRAVGYRQIWEYLDGVYSASEMLERGIAATRQLAKRQITWLRSDPGLQRIDACDPQALTETMRLIQNG